jgi:uncharacterized protein YfdQ (DUF2303 family)
MTIEGSAIEEIADLARESAEGEQLDPGNIYAFRVGDRIETVDLTGDQYRNAPKRKTGTTNVRDVDSFLAFYAKHSDDQSEIYADRRAGTVTAILDANTSGGPRWADHRVRLNLTHTDAFAAWAGISGKQLGQTAFAEFIEDHRSDVQAPAAADLLELAQDFQATTKATFRSGTVLKNGQRTITFVEQIDATAGKNGELTVPDTLELAVAIFEGAKVADALTARLRYRIGTDGKLALVVILDKLTDVVNGAFEGVIDEISDGLGKTNGIVPPPILRGTPA